MNWPTDVPALPVRLAAALYKLLLSWRASACKASRLRAPIPRVGKIHDAQKGGIVILIGNEPQIGQRMFDFLAFEEAQTAVHPIGNTRLE